MIIRTNLMPKKADGWMLFPFILIRKNLPDSTVKQLIAHETDHWWRFIETVGMYPFLWVCSKKLRGQFEARAYAASVDAGMGIEHAAKLLSSCYGLDITPFQAYSMIRAYRKVE